MIQDNFYKNKEEFLSMTNGLVSVSNDFNVFKNKYEYDTEQINNKILTTENIIKDLCESIKEYSDDLSNYIAQTFGNVFMLFAEMQESIITLNINYSIISAYLDEPWYKKITKNQKKKLIEKIKEEKKQEYSTLIENNRIQKEKIIKDNRERLNITKTPPKVINVKFEGKNKDEKYE